MLSGMLSSLSRDNGLMKEPEQLVAPFDVIPLFPRQSLALFTDVKAMTTPAELLVRTGSAANSAIIPMHLENVTPF